MNLTRTISLLKRELAQVNQSIRALEQKFEMLHACADGGPPQRLAETMTSPRSRGGILVAIDNTANQNPGGGSRTGGQPHASKRPPLEQEIYSYLARKSKERGSGPPEN